jgi:glucokinase
MRRIVYRRRHDLDDRPAGAPRPLTVRILAGDIGGTKTALALFEVRGHELTLVRDATYPSREFPEFEGIIRAFLSDGPPPAIAAACFGVAGVVVDGSVTITNLPWTLEAKTLRHAIPSPDVTLLNDLEATAWGVLRLPSAQFLSLQDGAVRRGHKALIAAGTGLGEALIIADGTRELVIASEGGHADFAPRTDQQCALLEYLRRRFDHVSYERVLSGPGLLNIYHFLRDTGGRVEPGWLADRLQRGDPSAVVSEVGVAGEDPNCVEALEMFASIYGAEAGNLALKVVALGGVYVAGGIAPKLRSTLADGRFVAAFRDKGRFAPMLESIPVRLALEPRAALLGAAFVASRSLEVARGPATG